LCSPMARLLEPVFQLTVALLERGFDVAPGGLGGVLGLVQFAWQLGGLVAQRLEFGFGFGFGGPSLDFSILAAS